MATLRGSDMLVVAPQPRVASDLSFAVCSSQFGRGRGGAVPIKSTAGLKRVSCLANDETKDRSPKSSRCCLMSRHVTHLVAYWLKILFMWIRKRLTAARRLGLGCSNAEVTTTSTDPEPESLPVDDEPSAAPVQLREELPAWNPPKQFGPALSIVVLGATGDLAKKKIFPALFALYYTGYLPEKIAIFGYSRSDLRDEDLRDLIMENLTCRLEHRDDCDEKMKSFLANVYYESGGYDACDGLVNLDKRLKQFESGRVANRVFYLSVPHDVLLEVARCVATNAQSRSGYTRVIVEKPFGMDTQSSAEMTRGILSTLAEDQIYRIDHLLGKDLIENLTVLRFSNLIFEPLWNRTYIKNVQITFSGDLGMQGRGRYFDEQGVIRDVVQSHILQTIALLAMEPPVSLDGEDIRNEKVKVLRSMKKPTLDDVVLGQYKESITKDGKFKIPGYAGEPDVPSDSLTPTFLAAALYIDNGRWDGVPFLVKAGHGLIKRKEEIRIQFRHVPGNLYRDKLGLSMDLATNELVLRLHPDDAAVFLKINNKVPGLGLQLDTSELNLLYRDKYRAEFPDSYERLILDVIDGDNHLFMRSDELGATWEILSPLLRESEDLRIAPELYTFGGRGPVGAYYLGARHGVRWADD